MKIDLGASSTSDVVSRGDKNLTILVKLEHSKCVIKNVYHVPQLRCQLLSVSTIAKLSIKTEFDDRKSRMIWMESRYIVATEQLFIGLHTLYYAINILPKVKALASNIIVCHNRLSHVSCSIIKHMAAIGGKNT